MNKSFLNDYINKPYFPKEGKALDIGCRFGLDSKFLIDRGFKVDALDSKSVPKFEHENFNFQSVDLRDFVFKENEYDLVLAHLVLPFLKSKEEVKKALDKIKFSMKKGGVAIVTLFGDRHQWKNNGNHYFCSREEAEELVGSFVDVEEIEKEVSVYSGDRVEWHSWNFVLVK